MNGPGPDACSLTESHELVTVIVPVPAGLTIIDFVFVFVHPYLSVTVKNGKNGPELIYTRLHGERVDVAALLLLNKRDTSSTTLVEVSMNIEGEPTQTGVDILKLAIIGAGTIITFVSVHVDNVTGSFMYKAIVCVPGVKSCAGGNATFESTVTVVRSFHCQV